jgi:hypothetical protein
VERGTGSVAGTTAWAANSGAEQDSFEPSFAGGLPTRAVDVLNVTTLVSGEKSSVEQMLGECLDRALVARGLHKREVRRPSLELMIRAAEAMRFSPRQQEVANLVASAMDPKFGSAVLRVGSRVCSCLSPSTDRLSQHSARAVCKRVRDTEQCSSIHRQHDQVAPRLLYGG